jgi:hypothetical protein
MPNVDAPFGFNPNLHQAGGCPNRLAGYEIEDGEATAIFSGDLVEMDTTAGGRFIQKAADGTTARILGVFGGCNYTDDQGEPRWSQYWPAAQALLTGSVAEANIYDDPGMELIAQITTVAAVNVGQAYEIDQTTNPGSTSTGRSAAYIDQAATTNPNVRVEGLAPQINGIFPSEYGAFAKVSCRILEHVKSADLTVF